MTASRSPGARRSARWSKTTRSGSHPTCTCPVGNGGNGVTVSGGATSTKIGAPVEEPPNNVIAYNAGDGVRIDGAPTTGDPILSNAIYADGGLRIALTNRADAGRAGTNG